MDSLKSLKEVFILGNPINKVDKFNTPKPLNALVISESNLNDNQMEFLKINVRGLCDEKEIQSYKDLR